MGRPAVLKIDIITDAAKAKKGLDDTATGVEKTGSKFAKLGGLVAGGVAVGAVIAFGKATTGAAQESAVATKRLDAIFKSMGDTTGEASKAAQAYAGTLSRKIGVDDEAIMAGQAMLATFKDVSSETARQAGIFDRATAAGADLAAAGFGTIEGNAVALGKALQDPTKGITALARSGVTFTDAQKKQIAAMQKSGDLLGAQKIVLAAVEGQVKGTAEATATSADKQNVAYGEMQETIGNKLLPVLALFQGMMLRVFDAIAATVGFIDSHQQVFLALAIGIGAIGAVILASLVPAFLAWAGSALAAAAATLLALSPFILIGLAVAALAYLIIRNWNTIKAVTAAVWNAILGAVKAVFNWIKANWPLLLAILTGPIGLAVLLIQRNWDSIKAGAAAVLNFFRSMAGWIAAALAGVAHAIAAPFIAGFEAVKHALQAAWDWISDKIGAIKRTVSSGINFAKETYNKFARVWNSVEVKVAGVKVAGKTVVPGFTFGLPDIPELARGAYLTRATLAVLGEGSGAEFAAPEPMLRQLIREEAGGRNNTYRISVNVAPLSNPAETGRAIVDAIRAFERAAGNSWRTA